ncbi:sensor histidine kinase [bacterium 1xD42-87]|jgi:two-component system sensor histidine kinase YesM|nr:sensor histidine kinase [bacterium 1xD42-87]
MVSVKSGGPAERKPGCRRKRMGQPMDTAAEKDKREYRRKKSLRWSMVRRLVFGWFLPLFIMICVVIFLMTGNVLKQVEQTIQSSVEKTVEIMQIQLKDCETASKNASYMAVISKYYRQYFGEADRTEFRDSVEEFLRQQYAYDDNCRTAELVVLNEPGSCYYALNESNGGSYQDIRFFQAKAREKILEVAETLDTGTTLVGIDGKIYMVRNLVTSKFVPYAVLALELDQDSLMKSYTGIWGYADAALYWNGELLVPGIKEHEEHPEHRYSYIMDVLGKRDAVYEYKGGGYSHAYRRIKIYGGTMVLLVSLDNSVTYAEMAVMQYFFLILFLFMIPLVVQMMRFFHNKVTVPLGDLMAAADMVKDGNLGVQVVNEEDNEEFYHMKESFNHMSRQLKSQFDKIYLEEVALRDAKIMALQSQINPHFLNNTLEIINWEARLNGNYKVSGMIEALSTMLGETMNRREAQFHSVAEEMAYADAYLYIISQRFGAKFRCEEKIDERLLNVQVPRLIIQPIVENAVEHGMDITEQGRLEVRLFTREDRYLCIEVEDNGHLTEEDRKRIDRILSQDIELAKEKRVSLGIRNVDQRLKMIYGADCGLFIESNEEDHTVSTILLKTEVPSEQ